ncbi:hypothetical protein [Aidingimonas lacisalsi]|uniref:hypothetical protein n=1 Tax=Aidingimonas lacisalsi TaxID=2604086 RepID=UPI0011D25883|nr:hypothetical protein [Aidingimonas lacisalsi]
MENNIPEGYRVFKLPNSELITQLDTHLYTGTPKQDFIVYVAEPFSWAVIAKKILSVFSEAIAKALEKAVEIVVGEIINAVLSIFIKANLDLSKIIEALLRDFSRILNDALNENALREAKADLRSIQNQMVFYKNSPESRKDSLNIIINESSKNLERLRSLDYAATPSYTLAASLNLSLNMEKYSISKSDGELENCKILSDQFLKTINEFKTTLIEETRDRFSEVIKRSEYGPPRSGTLENPTPPPSLILIWTYKLDGVDQGSWPGKSSGKREAEATRERHINELTKEMLAKTIAPAFDIAQQAVSATSSLETKNPPGA